jgi:hypothetical protein
VKIDISSSNSSLISPTIFNYIFRETKPEVPHIHPPQLQDGFSSFENL